MSNSLMSACNVEEILEKSTFSVIGNKGLAWKVYKS